MNQLSGTTSYPVSCPDSVWEDWKRSFATADVNVNEAIVVALAREVVWTRGEELNDNQLETYLQLIEDYDKRRD